MSAREIIARAIHKGGYVSSEYDPDEMFEGHPAWTCYDDEAREVELALTASGYRILGPGELDAETLERAAEEVATLHRPIDSQNVIIDTVRETNAYFLAEAAIRTLKGNHDDHKD